MTILFLDCILYFPCKITDESLPFFLFDQKLFNNPKFLLKTGFSHFVLCLISNIGSFQNISGTNAWAIPHLKFFGRGTVPSPLKSPPEPSSFSYLLFPSPLFIDIILVCSIFFQSSTILVAGYIPKCS